MCDGVMFVGSALHISTSHAFFLEVGRIYKGGTKGRCTNLHFSLVFGLVFGIS